MNMRPRSQRSQEEIQEMKRNFRMMNNRIETLKEEITTKDHGLVKRTEVLAGVDAKREKLRRWSKLIPKRDTWQEILASEY